MRELFFLSAADFVVPRSLVEPGPLFSRTRTTLSCTVAVCVRDNGDIVLVDAGLSEATCRDPNAILGAMRCRWLGLSTDPARAIACQLESLGFDRGQVKTIVATHCHFDHIGGVNAILAAAPGTPVYLGERDFPVVSHPFNQMPPEYPPVARIAGLRPASEAPLFRVLDTPGHTPGGVSYYLEDFDAGDGARGLLLSGDTLFAGSVGRTDFPGGDMATLMASLRSLKALPPGTLVVPGHGPETTLAHEFASNPFLAG